MRMLIVSLSRAFVLLIVTEPEEMDDGKRAPAFVTLVAKWHPTIELPTEIAEFEIVTVPEESVPVAC
jgi:hypothetical protein